MPHNNAICLLCEQKRRTSEIRIECSIDGMDIIEHGIKGFCPLNKIKFSDAQNPDNTSISRIPRDQWPRKFQRLAKKAIPTDRGVGDILQRRYARWGGELYKKLLANLGISCGCQSDQDRLNTLYPLP